MPDPRPSIPLDQLLVHRDWVRALARTLVRDGDRAGDVEQQTWLAAMRHPPRHAGSLRSWLAAVVRTAARNAQRGDVRRARHEAAAPPRPASRPSDDLVAEAELQNLLGRAVLDLDEPYRTTVLLRWFDGLPPREIAERMGVPVETVRTRLKRAHERLRERLDASHGGDRRAWSLLVLAWPELSATAPSPWPALPAAGVLLMGAAKKAAVAAVVAAVLAVGAWQVAETVGGGAGDEAVAPGVPAADAALRKATDRAERAGSAPPGAVAPAPADAETADGAVDVLVRTAAGAPVEGAVVEAHAWLRHEPGEIHGEVLSRMGAAPDPSSAARTGPDGLARLRGLERGRSATVVARQPGFSVGGTIATPGDAAAPARAEILLVPGHALRGRVVTPAGRPVAGALVLAGGVAQRWARSQGGSPLLAHATADGDGRFAFADLDRGEALLWAAPPGGVVVRTTTVLLPTDRETTIVLPDTGSVEGRVTDAATGAPIAGAVVEAFGWTEVDGDPLGATAETGPDGRYRIDGYPAGEVRLRAHASGRVSSDPFGARRRIVVPAGGVLVEDLRLARGGVLTGIVRGDGAPVAGAQVTAAFVEGPNVREAATVTGADGRYRIDTVPPGRTVVVVSAEGWFQEGFPPDWRQAVRSGAAPDAAVVLVPETGEASHDVELGRGLTVTGRVLGPDGAPLGGATVVVSGGSYSVGGPWRSPSARSAADGSFRVAGVPRTPRAEVNASSAGLARTSRTVELDAESGASGVELRLGASAVVRGRVSGPAGADLHGSWVEWTTWAVAGDPADDQWAWANARRAPRDSLGRFEATVAAATSEFAARAVAPGFPPSPPARLTIVPDRREYEVELTLVPGRNAVGRIVDRRTGAPLAGARVGLVRGGGVREVVASSRPEPVAAEVATTSATGEYVLRDLTDGPWELRVAADGFLPATLAFSVPLATSLDVALAPASALRGRARFEDGTPAAGVSVSIGAADGLPARSTTTDAEGAFEFTGTGDGPYAVSLGSWGSPGPPGAGAANVVSRTVPDVRPGAGPIDVVLEPAASISGRVVDVRGAAVASTWVQCDSGGAAPTVGGATSAADGTFVVLGLRAGTYRVTAGTLDIGVGGPAHVPATLEGVAAGATGVVLTLGDGLGIDGRVVDGEGRPAGVHGVRFDPLAAPGLAGSVLAAQGIAPLDADGRFRRTGLARGRYRVVLVGRDGRPTPLQADSDAAVEAGATGIRLVATSARTISGRVVFGDRGLYGVGVTAVPSSGSSGTIQSQTAYDGAFVLLDVEPGATYVLKAHLLGLLPAVARGVAAGTTGVELRCEQGLSVRGRAVDADGAPVANLLLWFQDEAADLSSSATTGEDGTFEAGGLREGAYRVRYEAFVPAADGSRRREWRECGTVRAGDDRAEVRVPR